MADLNRRSSRTSMRSKPLGQYLVENGDVSSDQLAQAVQAQNAQGGMIGAILQRMGACGPEAIGQGLSKQVQVTDIQCEDLGGTADVAKLVSRDFCNREKLCPFEVLGNLLCVVMGNPLNRKAISEVENLSRMKVKAFKAPWPKISELIERTYAAGAPAAKSKTSQPAAPSNEPPPLEDLSFELDDVPVAVPQLPKSKPPAAETKPADTREALSLDDDIIIPPSDLDEQVGGRSGILEVPMETIPLPSHAATGYGSKPGQPMSEVTIKGLDSLDFTGGELVDVAARKFEPGVKKLPLKAVPKVAKVNVDLENFDSSSAAEMIDTTSRPEHDPMDEIQHGGGSGETRKLEGVLVALKLVPDGYFYAGNSPKNAPRSDDLMDIIEALPVAEVVAETIADYERGDKGALESPAYESSGNLISMSGPAMAGKSRVDLQRAPATPMAAIRLGEGEFVKLTLSLVECEAGEWDWNFASTGPVAVEAFAE